MRASTGWHAWVVFSILCKHWATLIPANAQIMQMPRSCKWPDHANAQIMQMPRSFKCPDHANAQIMQMPRSCKCPDHANAQIMQMPRSFKCSDHASSVLLWNIQYNLCRLIEKLLKFIDYSYKILKIGTSLSDMAKVFGIKLKLIIPVRSLCSL